MGTLARFTGGRIVIDLCTSTDEFTTPVKENLALERASAHDRLAEVGWQAEPDGVLRVYGDVVSTKTSTFARYWHSQGEFRLLTPGAQRSTAATFVVEGSGTLYVGDRSMSFEAGDLVLSFAEQQFRYIATDPVAFMSMRAPSLDTSVATAGVFLTTVVPYSETFGKVFIEHLNAVLGSTVTPDDPGFRSVARSLDLTLDAAIISSLPRSASPANILLHANEVILENSSNPGFSVAELAVSINVSTRWLQEQYRRVGTSPKEKITAARLAAVESRLTHLDQPTQADLQQVVNESGFSSMRAYYRAKDGA